MHGNDHDLFVHSYFFMTKYCSCWSISIRYVTAVSGRERKDAKATDSNSVAVVRSLGCLSLSSLSDEFSEGSLK